MSMKLREIIKAIRACKTAEEERSVINKESAEIRNLPKDQSEKLKSRNIIKCIYMHFLGKKKL
jgi:AP-1 complex subunit gamma-1